MRAEAPLGIGRRALAVAAAMGLMGLSLWCGLRGRTSVVPGRGAAVAPRHGATPEGALRIVSGPEIISQGGKRAIRWVTSEPADSLLAYGRDDPLENVLVKDAARVTQHQFELPDLPFIEFFRFAVMSIDAHNSVVSAYCGPGEGSAGALLSDVSARHPAVCAQGGPLLHAAWADYDADGALDVVLCGETGGRLLRSEGGRFHDVTQRRWAPPGGQKVSGASWGDFDADGDLDLLTCGSGLSLYRNSGPSRWRLERVQQSLIGPASGQVRFARFAELNGDGLPDVLAVDAAGRLKVLINEGAPAFRLRPAPAPEREDHGPLAGFICADFTGRGHSELWLDVPGGLLLESASEGPEVALPHLGRTSQAVPAAAAGDFDADGDLDIYVPPYAGSGGGGALLINDGSGGFRRADQMGELAALDGAGICAAWADLTGNGYADLVVGLAEGGVRVFLNNGAGLFMDGTGLCAIPADAARPVRSVVLADFSSDCAPDLVVLFRDGGALMLENRATGIARGDFLTVRLSGGEGVLGAVVTLTDADGSRVIGSGRVAAGQGGMECNFGMRHVQEARVEVRFSDGLERAVQWVRGDSSHVLTVARGE